MSSAFQNYMKGPLSSETFGHSVPEDKPDPLRNLSFQDRARFHVMVYINDRREKTEKRIKFAEKDVYVVWFAKTLKNWKALISTTFSDGMYYEVTYNGENHETYIDAYKKFDNVCIPDVDLV